MLPKDEINKLFIKAIKQVAKKLKKPEHAVTRDEFRDNQDELTEWQTRKEGGFSSLKEANFNNTEEVKSRNPKILLLDIETSPIIGHVWGLWENNVGLNQVQCDWHVLSWSAKWLGSDPSEVMYMDQRNEKNMEDDSRILKEIWKLLDEADVIITQNGKSFDQKKLNARFIINGFQPPSSFKHIDTKLIAKKHFKFTSNKLEYMTDKLCKKYKKLKHTKFQGHELWSECLKGNPEAWTEMEKYNKYDVLSLEELYYALIPWDSSINFNLYTDSESHVCKCQSTEVKRNGYYYTNVGKYQRYKCSSCGAETRGRINLFSKDKKDSLHMSTVR